MNTSIWLAILILALSDAVPFQFKFFNKDRSESILEGNWQSCRESDGQFGERVYDGKVSGIPEFELHMGPYHEFALFKGIQEDHRDHDSDLNLLHPYAIAVSNGIAKQEWDVTGLHLEVVLAGSSSKDCESWYITLKKSGLSKSRLKE